MTDGEVADDPFETEYSRQQRMVEREFQARLKMEDKERGTVLGRISYAVHRMFMRALRIGAGVAFGVIAWMLLDHGYGLSQVPLAQMTLRDIVAAIFSVLFGLILSGWALMTAFGAAPTELERMERLRAEVANVVYRRR